MKEVTTVLFDLDGTLLDTVPTFELILNNMRAQHGLPPLNRDEYTPLVSHGAKAMVEHAFATHPVDEQTLLLERFLEIYTQQLTEGTTPFPGIEALLEQLEKKGYNWGVISNKAERFTLHLCQHFGWGKRAKVIYGGDSTSAKKPSPIPLLAASEALGVAPEHCIYVGDANKDIVAGNAAGMYSAVANFGYIPVTEDPHSWGADVIISEPLALIDTLSPSPSP